MSEKSKYKFPEDNENVLHIDSDCLPLSQERLLEECQSWRDYAGCVFDFIPDELDEKARELLKSEKE